MAYPNKLKEYFAPDGGINTILVKNGKTTNPPPPIENPCLGANDMVVLQVSYRGSDWGEGISSAVEVNGDTWNVGYLSRLLSRWGSVEFSVGGYDFVTTFEGGAGPGTLSIKPHSNVDYVTVKIIPNSNDPEGNRLLGVEGGGQITYDPITTIAEFCLKPELRAPISCFGALDRITVNTIQVSDNQSRVANLSESDELTYNVTVNGVDYGVVNFRDTPNPTFGNIGLKCIDEPSFGSGWSSLILTGGTIGQGYRFNLQSVPSLGGNNIYEIATMVDSEYGDPTVDYNSQTRDVEFCLVAMERCDGANNEITFEHYNYDIDGSPAYGQVFPFAYNVTANDIDYGVVNFIDPIATPEGSIRSFGDYTVKYVQDNWGGGYIALIAGPLDVPIHFKLDPVDAIVSNINYPDINRTVIYDPDTKAIEFCLVRGECSGATGRAVFNILPSETSGFNSFSEVYHSFNINGYILNGDHSVDLMQDMYHIIEIDGRTYEVLVNGNESEGIMIFSIGAQYGNMMFKVTATPPPPTSKNFVTGIVESSNPTLQQQSDGTVTFCLKLAVAE